MSAATLDAVVWAVNLAATAWLLRTQAGAARARGCRVETVTTSVGLVFSLLGRDWAASGLCVLALILLACDWWKRKGRRVARELGAKSLARLAAVVEKAREAGTPLREGAGA